MKKPHFIPEPYGLPFDLQPAGKFRKPNVADRSVAKHQAIKEFEGMRNMSELKALSSFSLEHPLSDKQFKRMMELKKKLL